MSEKRSSKTFSIQMISRRFTGILLVLLLLFGLLPAVPAAAKENLTGSTALQTDAVPESFSAARFRASKADRTRILLRWRSVPDARSYVIYRIGPSSECEKVTLTDAELTSYIWKGLKKNTYYSFYLEAYADGNAEGTPLLRSPRIYEATLGGKYTNPGVPDFGPALFTEGSPKKVRIITGNMRFIDVDTQTTDLTACFSDSSELTVRNVRYETTDSAIASVSDGQMLTAVHKGSCELYAYALNGKYRRVKVIVADSVSDDKIRTYGGYSLRNIAGLNNTTEEELTVSFEARSRSELLSDYIREDISPVGRSFEDAKYISLLGARFAREIITDETDAENVIYTYLSDLLGLPLVELMYTGTDISGVTGNRYYVFKQIKTQEYGDDRLTVSSQLGFVKLITDSKGNILGLTGNLIREEYFYNPTYKIFSKDEVCEWLRGVLDEEYTICDDFTHLSILHDAFVACDEGDGTIKPVWNVYISYKDEQDKTNYALCCISARAEENKPYLYCVSELYSEEDLGNDDLTAINLRFFDEKDFEDAGTVTYELDYTKYVRDHGAALYGQFTVTVPVMKEKRTGNYILGSMKYKVLPCNAWDAYEIINRVVTDDPSDINSWHFELPDDYATGRPYFCDPNYIIGAYSTLVEVVKSAEDIFGEMTDIPSLLLLYTHDGSEYPESDEEFDVIMGTLGRATGWNVIETQPNDESCYLLLDCVGHEYTHAFDADRTDSIYANESGSVSEAYANNLGNTIEVGCLGSENWYFMEAAVKETFYDLADPHYSTQPAYINDLYYIPAIENSLKYEFNDADGVLYIDRGGTHANSTVLTYLYYRMTVADELSAGEEALPLMKNGRLWYETTYMITADRSFENIGRLLSFAGKMTGLTAGEQAYADRLIFEHGLAGTAESREKLEALLDRENTRRITVHYTSQDENVLSGNVVGAAFYREDNWSGYVALSDTDDISGRGSLDKPEKPYCVIVREEDAKLLLAISPFDEIEAPVMDDYYVDVKFLELNAGDEYLFPDSITDTRILSDLRSKVKAEADGNRVIFKEAGIYNIVVHSRDMAPNEAAVYVVFVKQ